MIPFGFQTVTLLHKTGAGYARHVLTECSWRDEVEKTLSEGALLRTQKTTCRIPAAMQKPNPGDLLILGDVEAQADSAAEAVRLREALEKAGTPVFRVQTVKDNSRIGVLPHYAAEGA